MTDTILWRRLDAPGHDACRLEPDGAGWRLDGVAVFRHEAAPACLAYRVACDGAWRTREGAVRGWVGARPIEALVTRTAGGVWTCHGAEVPGLADCVDLDLGFTPATNLFQLRRIALPVGQRAAVPVAWLDVGATTLETVHQTYERRTAEEYWYESPRFAYAALLVVDPSGFVRSYPGLWEAEG